MAKQFGTLPEAPKQGLIGALASKVSKTARRKADFEGGEGVRQLLPVLQTLPDHMTVVIRPALGFGLRVDFAVFGAGKLLVINTVHWSGKVTLGEVGEWRSSSMELGRPDRRAVHFGQRMSYSGRAEHYEVRPLVVCTAGALEVAEKPEAPVLTVAEFERFLVAEMPANMQGVPVQAELIHDLTHAIV